MYRRGKAEHLAISDATFDVMPGELVSLVGPSGCGKSTLLKILAGLHGHDGGEVRIGSTTHAFDPSRDDGMVFQAPLLLKWRRILENVLLPAEILGLPMGEARERAQGLLSLVGLRIVVHASKLPDWVLSLVVLIGFLSLPIVAVILWFVAHRRP